jgi:hypothetical protein
MVSDRCDIGARRPVWPTSGGVYSDRMLRFGRTLPLLLLILIPACADPPGKEMNQAQGAIDAARAAGADKFAVDEFTAAVDALARSEEAVKAGDYRQALSHALDSRERAQNAAKMAVDARTNARGDAERATAEVATLLARADARLKDPAITRLPRGSLNGPRATIASATKAVQEARSALAKEDYTAVTAVLTGVAAQLQAALKAIDAAASPSPSRNR